MNNRKEINPEALKASGKRDVAEHIAKVLSNGGTQAQQIEEVLEIATYFASVVRNQPRDRAEALGMEARREMAGDVHSIIRAERDPKTQVESVRSYISAFICN